MNTPLILSKETITPYELSSLLKKAPHILILDVREPFEFDLVHLTPSLNIPLRELSSRVEELPFEKVIIVVCHHGVRSQQACIFLKSVHKKALNLLGGIDRFARDIDRSMKRY